jgi:hypothetical protein
MKMLFQRVNRSDAERVFVVVQNVTGAALVAGDALVLDHVTTVDGVRAIKPVAANLNLVGLAASAIADTAYGLAQAYGLCTFASVLGDTTPTPAGDIIMPTTGSHNLGGAVAKTTVSNGSDVGQIVLLVTGATDTLSARTSRSVFIRCL